MSLCNFVSGLVQCFETCFVNPVYRSHLSPPPILEPLSSATYSSSSLHYDHFSRLLPFIYVFLPHIPLFFLDPSFFPTFSPFLNLCYRPNLLSHVFSYLPPLSPSSTAMYTLHSLPNTSALHKHILLVPARLLLGSGFRSLPASTFWKEPTISSLQLVTILLHFLSWMMDGRRGRFLIFSSTRWPRDGLHIFSLAFPDRRRKGGNIYPSVFVAFSFLFSFSSLI